MLNLEIYFQNSEIDIYKRIDKFIKIVNFINNSEQKILNIYEDYNRKAYIELLTNGKVKFLYIRREEKLEQEFDSLDKLYQTNEFKNACSWVDLEKLFAGIYQN